MPTNKPSQKSYLSSPELDSLARMQTELLSELWILRDRVTILEHLLTESTILSQNQIDTYDVPPTLEKKLACERDKLVARVIGAGHRRGISVAQIQEQENKKC